MTSVDTNTQWREDWSSASVVNHTIVINPTIRQPGFDLPRHTWSLTIRFRTCRANLNKWGLAQSPSCDSSQRKTMNHTVDTCPLTKFEGGLNLLHEVDDDAVIWLEATATAALAEQIITSYSQTEWVAACRLRCCRHARPSQTSPDCCAASPSLKQRHHRWCQAEAASSAAAAAGVTPAAEQRESTTAASLQTSPDRQPYKHTHTHTRLMTLCPGLPRAAGTRKVKPTWILLKQETVSGSGIIWAICKSAPHSRQTTTPAPHHSRSFTGRMSFLPPNQQRQSTEGISTEGIGTECIETAIQTGTLISRAITHLSHACACIPAD